MCPRIHLTVTVTVALIATSWIAAPCQAQAQKIKQSDKYDVCDVATTGVVHIDKARPGKAADTVQIMKLDPLANDHDYLVNFLGLTTVQMKSEAGESILRSIAPAGVAFKHKNRDTGQTTEPVLHQVVIRMDSSDVGEYIGSGKCKTKKDRKNEAGKVGDIIEITFCSRDSATAQWDCGAGHHQGDVHAQN